MALNIIKDVHTQKKIPIIVGGTDYHIEALLWDFLVDSKESNETIERGIFLIGVVPTPVGMHSDYSLYIIFECERMIVSLNEDIPLPIHDIHNVKICQDLHDIERPKPGAGLTIIFLYLELFCTNRLM